ncbi:hypothetical protein C1H46_013433 [Malus baccata]|uniref:Uncharacterized protein n=1 Tax=Malus baccata TaxID=106549 RepID=A0A540MRL4_MALBA|nr:hypothetical protein C1H46_013433 [Malus baccata]
MDVRELCGGFQLFENGMEWSEKCRELRREVSFSSELRARASRLCFLRNGVRVRAREVKRVDVVVV